MNGGGCRSWSVSSVYHRGQDHSTTNRRPAGTQLSGGIGQEAALLWAGLFFRSAAHVNADMLLLYHDIGCVRIECQSWGNKVIENLAADIRTEFSNSKGYSVRNLKYMAKFAKTYPDREFVQQVVAQIPWGQNTLFQVIRLSEDFMREAEWDSEENPLR